MEKDLEELESIKQVAGKDLSEKLLCLASEKTLITWFQTPLPQYLNKCPYDICREGGKLREKFEKDITGLYQGDFPR